jgi:cytochrome oxidase Cu insertion factor (SCO1/SenC/PrrC family)
MPKIKFIAPLLLVFLVACGVSTGKLVVDNVTANLALSTAAGAPFGLFYQLHEGGEATEYLVDHSTRTYPIDPEGNLRVAYAHGTPAADIAADLLWLIENEL